MALIKSCLAGAGGGTYNPTTIPSVSTGTGFTAEVDKHYIIALNVNNSSATGATFSGFTIDATVASFTPSGSRQFVYVGTATSTTVTANFVGTTESGTMYPCQLD